MNASSVQQAVTQTAVDQLIEPVLPSPAKEATGCGHSMVDQVVQTKDPGQYLPPPPPPAPPPPAPTPQACDAQPLNTAAWKPSSLLKIQEATTCHFKAQWLARAHNIYGDWPRTYDYHPNADGWIRDTFIRGGLRGDVEWNLKTNAGRVFGVQGGSAQDLAKFAKSTMFPGLDLGNVAG